MAYAGCALALLAASDPIESGFADPPEQTRPWCYWYWISDHLSKEGITRDLEAYVEKQLGKMHPTPLPMWDTYLWPTQAEPESTDLVVPASGVRDLASRMAADGTLNRIRCDPTCCAGFAIW
jgi:hypothetical protein